MLKKTLAGSPIRTLGQHLIFRSEGGSLTDAANKRNV